MTHEQTSKASKLLEIDGSCRPKFYSDLIERLGGVEGLLVKQINSAEHDDFQILNGNSEYTLYIGTVAFIKSKDLDKLIIQMLALATIFDAKKCETYESLAAFISLLTGNDFSIKYISKRVTIIFNKMN